MSGQWAYEDTAKLRERITVIETNLPLMRRELQLLSEGQANNRAYSEERFGETDKKLSELTTLIKAIPVTPKPQNDRTFVGVMVTGAIATLALIVIVVFVIMYWTGERANEQRRSAVMGEAGANHHWVGFDSDGGNLLFRSLVSDARSACLVGSLGVGVCYSVQPVTHYRHFGIAVDVRERFGTCQRNHQCILAAVGCGVAGGALAQALDREQSQSNSREI